MAEIRLRLAAIFLFGVAAVFSGDLKAVRAQPDLNKRAELAMENADESVDAARRAFNGGNMDQAHAAVADIQASVQLACDSLRETRKQPRNNKYYKRVELNMRSLLRRVDALDHDAPFEERGNVEQMQKRLQELHDQILLDIMSKRK